MPRRRRLTPRKPRTLSWRQAQRLNPTPIIHGPTSMPAYPPTVYILPGNRVIFYTGTRRTR